MSSAIPAPPGSIDAGVAWHYGDPHAEQRALESGRGIVDLGHRDVLSVSGPDRLRWLHDLTTAHLADLPPGESRIALILSPHGHVEQELTWSTTAPSPGSASSPEPARRCAATWTRCASCSGSR